MRERKRNYRTFSKNFMNRGLCVGQSLYVEVEVEYAYEAEQSDELSIKVGDVLSNVVMSEGGWWEGELNGKKGMFPDNFVKVRKKEEKEPKKKDVQATKRQSVKDLANKLKLGPHNETPMIRKKDSGAKKKRAKVVFSYEPEQEDELKLELGEVLDIIKQEEEGWWEGQLNGQNTEEHLIKGKKVQGIGLGNIFGDGPIKLRKTGEKKPMDKPQEPPKAEKREEPAQRKPKEIVLNETDDDKVMHTSMENICDVTPDPDKLDMDLQGLDLTETPLYANTEVLNNEMKALLNDAMGSLDNILVDSFSSSFTESPSKDQDNDIHDKEMNVSDINEDGDSVEAVELRDDSVLEIIGQRCTLYQYDTEKVLHPDMADETIEILDDSVLNVVGSKCPIHSKYKENMYESPKVEVSVRINDSHNRSVEYDEAFDIDDEPEGITDTYMSTPLPSTDQLTGMEFKPPDENKNASIYHCLKDGNIKPSPRDFEKRPTYFCLTPAPKQENDESQSGYLGIYNQPQGVQVRGGVSVGFGDEAVDVEEDPLNTTRGSSMEEDLEEIGATGVVHEAMENDSLNMSWNCSLGGNLEEFNEDYGTQALGMAPLTSRGSAEAVYPRAQESGQQHVGIEEEEELNSSTYYHHLDSAEAD
ncbi:SH3K1-like protein [Mya arenaria]|uniref:SH3K1-like protein n=1 Tax=Mya arenaria TaxID=6604 RepID=A0ABY7EF80_MYAAR|nr:SH3K1-like protein [Mya arenaria]